MRLKLPPSCPAERNVMAFPITYPTSGFHAVFLGASLAWWISPGHPGMQTRCVHFRSWEAASTLEQAPDSRSFSQVWTLQETGP